MENVRIQDDLYNHVNGETLENLVIPDDLPTVGGFTSLAIDIQKLMMGEFEAMSSSGEYPNEYLRRSVTVYKMAKDKAKKAKYGIKPALKHLAPLSKIDTFKKMNNRLLDMILDDIPLPFGAMIEADMKLAGKNALYLTAPSVILPDASYYKPEMAPQKEAILGIWQNMAKMILAKTPLTAEEQESYLADTLAFDELLGGLVKTQEEHAEYVKMYNPVKLGRAAGMVAPLNLKNMLRDMYGFLPETVIITEPRYFKAFKTVFNAENFEKYRHWAFVTGLISSCPLLSEELRELGSIYQRAIMGVSAVTPIEKFSYELASNIYAEPVGIYYGEKYFGKEAKADVTSIVYQIIDMYKQRIKTNDFLTDATKEKAIVKLSSMGVKMGYPDRVDPYYDELLFDENASLFDAVISLRRIERLHAAKKLTKPVDRGEWAMPGHMVNACYNPFVNDITFPAAILQAPFYSLSQSRSENLGGIGAVIGHEISHAFDSNGAKFDENGVINNWWTREDNKNFQKKINAMIKQFDKIELPWGVVNGKFIVSENMADNGGVAVTLAIMENTDGANYEEYFKNWARVWCIKAKPEYLQLLLSIDVHGPAILRANMAPRNFDRWYTTFGVKKTDKMYITPTKRVIIW
jgi:putative endopeptidase